jgi:hypothetical protein
VTRADALHFVLETLVEHEQRKMVGIRHGTCVEMPKALVADFSLTKKVQVRLKVEFESLLVGFAPKVSVKFEAFEANPAGAQAALLLFKQLTDLACVLQTVLGAETILE